jgi:hypothetical protein
MKKSKRKKNENEKKIHLHMPKYYLPSIKWLFDAAVRDYELNKIV